MKLHELSPAKGSRRPRKRVGRGQGAGQGKTSGRGQKGQGSRSSFGLPAGFEGGQMPLKQRLPKLRGFHNRWRHEYVVVNLGKLVRFEKDSVVDPDVLTEAGLIPRASSPVKVLAAGHLGHALTLRVHRISAAARTAVEVGRRLCRAARRAAACRRRRTGRQARTAQGCRNRGSSRAAGPPEDRRASPRRRPRARRGPGQAALQLRQPSQAVPTESLDETRARDDSAPAPDAEPDAPQENEAETEDKE